MVMDVDHDHQPLELLPLMVGMDIVLVEGFKKNSLPKIEVHRKGHRRELICRGAQNDPALLAVASDEPLDLDVPVLDLDDPDSVAAFVVERILR